MNTLRVYTSIYNFINNNGDPVLSLSFYTGSHLPEEKPKYFAKLCANNSLVRNPWLQ